MPANTSRVAYVTSPELRKAADCLPSNPGRSSIVHSLIESYGLLSHDENVPETARLVNAPPATSKDIARFHSPELVDCLLNSQHPDNTKHANEELGLTDDCPWFDELPAYTTYLAGASLTAARLLRDGEVDIAICWDGGRHHASKDRAAGFCYINDIVLAVLELQKLRPGRKRLSQVMVIDLDLHHADGTQQAFEHSKNVTTVSMHAWYKGFFPSTPEGALDWTGPPQSASGCFNVALSKSGLSSQNLLRLLKSCIEPIFRASEPDALILQCGVDGLAGDPCKEWNVDLCGYGKAVEEILGWTESKSIPVLMLGGGGYHSANAARAWAYLTSIATRRPLSHEGQIPEECEYWDEFGPDFTLDVPAIATRLDEHSEQDLARIEKTLISRLYQCDT